MKVLLKGLLVFCGVTILALTLLHSPIEAQAASSDATVKKTYVSYLKKQIDSCAHGGIHYYCFYDFNKDGTKELVVSYDNGGAHGGSMDVYTYRNKKVVLLEKDVSEVGFIKGKKYLVCYSSGGAMDNSYCVYKINKDKLVQVNKYERIRGECQKDGKSIEESQYYGFGRKVVTELGKWNEIGNKYYSPKQLGITVLSREKKHIVIDKIEKNKIYYQCLKYDENGQMVEKKDKVAKITSKTKYYYGNTVLALSENRYNDVNGGSYDTLKWIFEVTKKEFIKKIKNDYRGFDKMIIKNGKVEKVIIHITLAG